MAVDATTQITIARPPEAVAAFAGDPSNAPRWYVNIDSVEWQTPPPLAVGSRLTFRARFLGRTLTYTYEVVDLDPGRRLTMTTAQGPFPMETSYVWEPVGDGATTMTLRNRGEPTGFAALTSSVLAAAMRRANSKDLAQLRAILEAPQESSSRRRRALDGPAHLTKGSHGS
jgi:uncharacterized membrane protein